MNFSVSLKELVQKLQVAIGVIASNNTMAILDDFLFSIRDGVLYISASDMETLIQTKLEVVCDENGEIAIPARILLDTLKNLPDQPLNFLIDGEHQNLQITSSVGKYHIACNDPSDFPQAPAIPDDKPVQFDASALLDVFSKTAFTIGSDVIRPAMTGLFFDLDFNHSTFVSTDAHRLVKYRLDNTSNEVLTSFILPKKSLSLISKILHEMEELEVRNDGSHAFFTGGEYQIISRLIDARFPDYESVIPGKNELSLVINRRDLLQSLRRIVIYSNQVTRQVKLEITPDSLTITGQDLDFSNEATEQLNCSYNGEPMVVAYNARFLLDMLNVMESEEVILKLASPTIAGLLEPMEQAAGTNVVMLIMPVMHSR